MVGKISYYFWAIKIYCILMKNLYTLNRYIKKYTHLLLIGSIFILISNIFALYPAEYVKESFDTIENSLKKDNPNIKYELFVFGTLILFFALLKGIFMFFMRQTIIVMSRKIEFDLKNDIYKKYQFLNLFFYKKNNTGDLMNRITEDVSRVRMYLGPAIMYAINLIFLFSLVIWRMTSISPTLTTYVLIPLPILAITVYFVSHHINKNSEKVQIQLSNLTSISQESYSAINIIKTFQNEDNSYKMFFKSCKEYMQRQLKLVSIEAWFFPLIIFLIGISTITTIYIGGIESMKIGSNVTTGTIAEFIIYVNMLTWPVASVGWVTSIIQRAEASMQRINDFKKNNNIIPNTNLIKVKTIKDIKFENVSFKYKDTNIQALKNINFQIKKGETLGVFGKTGSGKSTIANLICRLYDCDSGKILVNNNNIMDIKLSGIRSKIGYVQQDSFLFSGNIAENIAFGKDQLLYEKVYKCAETSSIHEEILSFQNKYFTLIGERGVQLSGGQKQRISIARAIYTDPEIFIFDDCLSAIDADQENKILKNIKNQTQDTSTVIISHRTSSIQHADEIIVLEKGSISCRGTHKELMESENFYSYMHKEQTKKNNLYL